MEHEIETLINDLDLPRDVIQDDVAKGRLLLNQHRGDPKYYVDDEILVDYLTTRVTELRPDQKKTFWQAVRRIVVNPEAEKSMDSEELRAIQHAIDRELTNC